MNLMEVLLFQERKELKKLLNEVDCTLNINSKRELIELLYPSLQNSDELATKFQWLTLNSQKLVMLLAYDKSFFLSKEELHGFLPQLSRTMFQEVQEELVKSGLLFVYENNTFLIPSQIKQQLKNNLKKNIELNALILPNELQQQKELSIVNDLFVLIDYVSDKPIALTKNGVLYKKDFQAIMNAFMQKEILPAEQWRFGYGRRFAYYPDRFSLLYDFCFSKKWIVEENELLLVSKHVDELYEMRLNDLVHAIVTYWQKLYRRPIPTIKMVVQLILIL